MIHLDTEYTEGQILWLVVWIGSTHPHSRKRVCPAQDPSGKDTQSLAEKGVGVANSDEGTNTLNTNPFSLLLDYILKQLPKLKKALLYCKYNI